MVGPRAGMIVLFVVGGLGCSAPPSAPPPPEGATETPAPVAEAPPAVLAEDEALAFDGRDPFEDLYTAHADKDPIDLSAYRVSAIVTGTSVPRALVVDRTGAGRSVRIGDVLGAGVVVRIEPRRVVVETRFRTAEGRVVKQRDELPLRG